MKITHPKLKHSNCILLSEQKRSAESNCEDVTLHTFFLKKPLSSGKKIPV